MVELKYAKGEVLCEVEAGEEVDWDYARNRQILLRDVLLEYSTSSFNAPIVTPIGVLHGGNRDFSWQGLLVGPIDGALYKVLDAVYYRPLTASNLELVLVKVGRRRARYIYVDDRGEEYSVSISIGLGRRGGFFRVSASRPSIFAPIFAFYDMTTSVEHALSIAVRDKVMVVEGEHFPLRLYLKGFDDVYEVNAVFDWVYKLGDGFRTIQDGKVFFIRHVRRVRVPIALRCEQGFLDIEVPLMISFRRIDYGVKGRLKRLHGGLKKKAKGLPVKVINAIVLRVDRLLSFGVPLDSTLAPEAGAMWFKRIWTRDLFEGLRWNLLTYTNVLGLSKWLVELIRKLMSIVHEFKGFKTLIHEGGYSSDAFPQLMSVIANLYSLTGERRLLKEGSKLMLMACKLMRAEEGFSGCVVRDGLILCKANSSWIDVVHKVDGIEWPVRLPLDWLDKVQPQGLFALVEVNALFIEGLDALLKAMHAAGIKADTELHELKVELIDGYRKCFYSSSGLPPLTMDPSSKLIDKTPSSAGVTAVALLKNIVYHSDLSSIWSDVERIIVKRRLVSLGGSWEIFGVVARRMEEKPYLGDLEYHGPVVWPRDTPYLIEVMRAINLDPHGVLINNLDHMVSEGAIGYSNELFSLPVGMNPNYVGEVSLNPVPVKNYAQYWSHWCDPYIEYFLLR
ncbi:MAG: hypothetical protein N3F04_05360 [Candidatus Nezhaarchaeota archaeon]|nr:hypothetical protein [Candidatus Nezhaarchaeota archaeon]MCX8142170.1 hypothetical protein [Candidatus Nezhaarchaeota archaeon]MDW8050047.1 hypothetical protein [Nitrososphaerota archaeon]